MKIARAPHRWKVTPKRAITIQNELAGRVVCGGSLGDLELVAGADLAFSRDGTTCIAGVLVWSPRDDEVIERHIVRRPVSFPYVPGLLTFREAPALLAAFRRLRTEPDAIILDGQGYSHPRRLGLASHVGLLLDRPTIGCAKSLLIGDHAPLPARRGSRSPLVHRGERVGMAVRTRDAVRPVYVSVGHRVSLEEAVRAVLSCCTRYRVPEPTRLADRLVSSAREGRPMAPPGAGSG